MPDKWSRCAVHLMPVGSQLRKLTNSYLSRCVAPGTPNTLVEPLLCKHKMITDTEPQM